MYEFELGPIRPPSEAYSVLLRLTRNCPWNKCAFCPVYKGERFSLRSVEDIKHDINSMHAIYAKIVEKVDFDSGGYISDKVVTELIRDEGIPQQNLQQMLFWIYYGMKSMFLQDADSMVVKPDDMVEILNYVREKFPSIERITCYSRSKTLVVKSPEDLKRIREAGLSRIHIGMESGSDDVLKLVRKGVTGEEQIKAGQKVVEAGFELSQYFMPGLGGREFTEQNAVETARVINAVNPSFVRVRTTTPVPGTDLYGMMKAGKWQPLTETEKVEELKKMLELLTGIDSYIQSDHMMNLIEDSNGRLPDDREKILAPLEGFLGMSLDDQECFIIARRSGNIRFFSDYSRNKKYIDLRDRYKEKFGTVEEAAAALSANTV